MSSFPQRGAPYHSQGRSWGASFRARAELSSEAMTSRTRHRVLLAAATFALVSGLLSVDVALNAARAHAVEESQTRGADSEAEVPPASVVIDGNTLFSVRGTSLFPAEKRAAGIASRIRVLAADRAVPVDAVHAVEIEGGASIEAPGHRVMTVFDTEARYESMDRRLLTEALVRTIRGAVVDYRGARSREALIRSAAYSGLATAILAALVSLVVWLSRRAQTALESSYRQRVHSVGIQSFQIVRAEQIWVALRRALIGVRAIVILGLVFVYVQYVLALFPWTRTASNQLFQYLLDPLATMGWGLVGAIPDVVFLVILFFIT